MVMCSVYSCLGCMSKLLNCNCGCCLSSPEGWWFKWGKELCTCDMKCLQGRPRLGTVWKCLLSLRVWCGVCFWFPKAGWRVCEGTMSTRLCCAMNALRDVRFWQTGGNLYNTCEETTLVQLHSGDGPWLGNGHKQATIIGSGSVWLINRCTYTQRYKYSDWKCIIILYSNQFHLCSSPQEQTSDKSSRLEK